jgi:large subunit ribosomal protein L1
MAEAKKKTVVEEKDQLEAIKNASAEAVGEEAKEVVEEVTAEEAEARSEKKTTAKAGKRSAKAIAEAEEKQAKEARKAASKDDKAEKVSQPKPIQKSRTVLERKGKKFRKAAELIEKDKQYSLKDALDLATKTNPAKFDAAVELHVRLGVDPRQADQNLRDIVLLPAGTGKTVRVAVFADPEGASVAKKAGADIAAADEFLQQLDKGTIDFDILISTPQNMAKLGKYARVLGPKGLMPNPKSGTVTTDIAKAVSEAKAGRVEYRVDSTGIVHIAVGKVSFGADKLHQNTRAVLDSIKSNKPSSIKGTYVRSVFVTTSMGPSIAVETSEV